MSNYIVPTRNLSLVTSGTVTTTADDFSVDPLLERAYEILRRARYSHHGPAQKEYAALALDALADYLEYDQT